MSPEDPEYTTEIRDLIAEGKKKKLHDQIREYMEGNPLSDRQVNSIKKAIESIIRARIADHDKKVIRMIWLGLVAIGGLIFGGIQAWGSLQSAKIAKSTAEINKSKGEK